MKIRFSSDPQVAHETNGLAVRYAASKRQIANWRWRILVLFVLAPLMIFAARQLYSAVWADMPGFIVMDETVMRAPVGGRIVSTVQVGQAVRAGDTIARLSNEVLEKEYATLLENEKSARPVTPTSAVRHAGSQDVLDEAREMVELRREQYTKISELAEQSAATQAEVAAAFVALMNAQRDLRDARAQTAGGTMPVSARPALRRDPRIAEVEAMLEALQIKATDSGMVAQVFAKQGEWVMPNAEVATLRLQKPAKIEVFVEPSWAKYATVGSWASVKFFDGYAHRARVREVKLQAQRLPPDRANPLTVRHHSVVVLLEPDQSLPAQYQVNVLPVNVQFDRGLSVERLAFWKTQPEHVAAR
ncbi:MAG TPA: hypothetical protein VIG66_00165 [Noviherbaspirillum sp.]